MKKKIVSTIVITMLLIGAIGVTFNFATVTADPVTYYWLTIETNPSGLYVWPSPPAGNHTAASWVNVTAPAMIDLGPGARAVFQSWSGGDGSAGTYSVWAQMTANKTVTAVYTKYYKLRVESPYATVHIHNGSWYQTNEAWIQENTNALAGVSGLFGTPKGVYVDPDKWAYFVNWTGDASGKHLSGVLPATGYYSDPINMTGPKTAVAEWAFQYKLNVLSGSPPPAPPGTGWYNECTSVTLVAPSPPPGWATAKAQWVFDYWTLDSVKQTPPDATLIVHMDTNHTATVFYKRQSKLTLWDNVANLTGIRDTGNWYDNCINYTFSVPATILVGGGVRWAFNKWVLSGVGNIGTTSTITLHCDPTWDGAQLKAVYKTQFYLGLSSSGSSVPGYLYPDSDTSGWYDSGVTINLKAKPQVDISSTKRYMFIQWKNHLGGTNANNNITFVMNQPWNVTAEYQLEWLAQWDYSPTSISIAGWPGSSWIPNGTAVSYTAPNTDDSGVFVFYYWVINGVTYAQGLNPVNLGLMTGPISGTAFYANKTKMFIDPSYHEEIAHAYCNKFNVTIYATNFDSNRMIGGQPQDIYGFEIQIKFNATLLDVQAVFKNLDDFFAPNDYRIAFEKLDNAAGTYMLAASVLGNFSGFSGTKAMFTLEFHVKYDPCYPKTGQTYIEFDPLHRTLVNRNGVTISPELHWKDCTYKIKTVQPMLEIKDATDGDNLIKVDKNVPTTFFDVDVYLHNGVKVHDFYVQVNYDKTQIEAMSVAIADYLKPPYIKYEWWISKSLGRVYVRVAQDASVPLQNCSGLLFTITFKVIATIYYTVPGPHTLTSDITIGYGELSVKCPSPTLQTTTNSKLGSKKATYLYNPLPGDLDADGCVTVLDLQLISDNYLKVPVKYDITGDGKTDILDFVFVALRFSTCI